LANSNDEGKTYICPFLEPCAPPVRAPLMGTRVCAHATHVAGAAATIRGARVRATWPWAPPPRGPALPRAPLACARPPCRARPLAVHAPFSVRPPLATHAFWPCAPPSPCARPPCRARPRGRARPSLPCAPHVRAFLTRPRPYRVRLPSISPTNLLFIPPLGHLGL
jgi:hypothetical protein